MAINFSPKQILFMVDVHCSVFFSLNGAPINRADGADGIYAPDNSPAALYGADVGCELGGGRDFYPADLCWVLCRKRLCYHASCDGF